MFEIYHIHMLVVATTHVCKLLLQRISSHTDAIKIKVMGWKLVIPQ